MDPLYLIPLAGFNVAISIILYMVLARQDRPGQTGVLVYVAKID